jgi:hypothetical protein
MYKTAVELGWLLNVYEERARTGEGKKKPQARCLGAFVERVG